MTIKELQFALAVEPEDSELNQEGLPDQSYLLSMCGGLVMISGDTETVRFIHYTVQEYFERAHHPQFSSAHSYLATTCITYLSFSAFADGSFRQYFYRSPRRFLDRQVLFWYASRHWGDHVRECCDQDSGIHATVRSFLTRKANVLFSFTVAYSRRVYEGCEPLYFHYEQQWYLHMAAVFGLDWLIEELLQQGADLDARDWQKQTPLHRAIEHGHTSVVKRLLERGANPESRDRWTRDAMEIATITGNEPITRLLMQEAFLPDMERVVSGVVEEGHLGILRLILGSFRDTSEKVSCVGTALLAASSSGHEACVRLLLEEVEDLEMSEIQSSLDRAMIESLRKDNFVITQLFLEYGASLTEGLLIAAKHYDMASARYLLDRGANIEAFNSEGNRPIHLSCSPRFCDDSEAMLKFLVERGADIDARGSDKKTPLMILAAAGYADLVAYLLRSGADVLAKDGKFNRSAIEWVVPGGHWQVVQLLLKCQSSAETGKGLIALTRLYQGPRLLDTKKVDSNAAQHGEGSDKSDFNDESSDELDSEARVLEENKRLLSDINTLQPEDLKRLLLLHLPARKGDETIFRAFIDMGADIEAFDDAGYRALHRAAMYGRTNTIRLLLDHGAMVDSQKESNSGLTPLAVAVRFDSNNSVQLLIESGADIERDSEDMGPPLMAAVDRGNRDIVCLLLDSGADPITKMASGHGGSVVHRAVFLQSIKDYREILRLLVTRGADLEARDHDGKTPLLLAVELAQPNRVRDLLELGADPTSVGDDTMPRMYTDYGFSYADDSTFEYAMQLIKDAKQR